MNSRPSSSAATGTSSFSSSTNATTTSSQRSNAYHRNFRQHLTDFRVYPNRYVYPDGRVPPKPSNLDEIHHRLRARRRSLSPTRLTEQAFDDFCLADANAAKEKQVSESVVPIIEGSIQDSRCVAGGIPFNNLESLTNGTIGDANPDRYYGARPEQLNLRVREELEGHIVPSTQHDLPIVPSFFLEVKGPDGSLAVAERQACYDGALGARGIYKLQSYGLDEPIFDNQAHTIDATYHGGTLKLYTTHLVRSLDDQSEYIMTQIKTWGMTSDRETFCKGAAAYRNLRDWAKEQRDTAIAQANARASNSQASMATDTLEAVSSFASEDSSDNNYEIEPASQTSLNSDATILRPQTPERATSPTKHLASPSDEMQHPRKRHNPGGTSDEEAPQIPGSVPTSPSNYGTPAEHRSLSLSPTTDRTGLGSPES